MDNVTTLRGSTIISRVMIFIDGHYFVNHIKTKIEEGRKHTELEGIRWNKVRGEITYSGLLNYLVPKSKFGTPTLVRCYFYDGLPDPDQNLSYLDGSEQTQRKK